MAYRGQRRVFSAEDGFLTLHHWDTAALLEDLRASILRCFVRSSKLSQEVADNLGDWALERSGFSCFVGSVIPDGDKDGLGRLIRYLFRSPVSYRQLSYDEASGTVRCSSKRGGHREWAHPSEFLATLAQHIPRPRQQTVTYAGYYANATGNLNSRSESKQDADADDGASPTKSGSRKRWAWAALIARVWSVDPEKCPRCGEKMKRERPIKDFEKLRAVLLPLKMLGYPPRPPPALFPDPNSKSAYSADPFPESQHQDFQENVNQIPPGW